VSVATVCRITPAWRYLRVSAGGREMSGGDRIEAAMLEAETGVAARVWLLVAAAYEEVAGDTLSFWVVL